MNYLCPKCKKELLPTESGSRCADGHCFDRSRDGYVNLLISNGSASHGDNKTMIQARRDFLSLGHYGEINEVLSALIADTVKKDAVSGKITVLDAGCGEGYYTESVSGLLSKKGTDHEIYGIDVSKEAIKAAAKRGKKNAFSERKTFYSVASVNALPFPDGAFDVVLSLFAPLSEKEFARVLKDGGLLITVSPSENHLFGLKKLIYDTPYKNPETTFSPTLFRTENIFVRPGNMTLERPSDIKNLFTMTPYFYNTKSSELGRIDGIDRLDTEIGFVFGVYRKL